MKETMKKKTTMNIEKISDEEILFDNGTKLSYYHEGQCCEEVYPDFKYLKCLGEKFDLLHWCYPADLQIEIVKDTGFRFGGKLENCENWTFVPCYNAQNGYYDDNLELIITYPDKTEKRVDIRNGLQFFLYQPY